MYTQCPECEVAFRVTADVLRQAAGKVRCGGCGSAFNALAHLSEDMPATAATENPPGEAGSPPQSISAEQSAALLKTLDQLAGEDIRIEDTGVEWRVIDVDEDDEIADDPVPASAHEEMRFDDNTPLPDDFDLDMPSAPPPSPEPVDEEPEFEPQLEESQVDLLFGEPDEWEDLLDDLEEVAAEIETSAPDEDIEVVEALAIDGDEIDAPESGVETELVSDATPEPVEAEEDVSPAEDDLASMDMDAQFARQAEKLGLDLTGMQRAIEEEVDAAESDDEDSVVDEQAAAADIPEEVVAEEIVLELDDDTEDQIDPGETSIEEDLIAAAFEVEAAAKAEAEPQAEPELEDVPELQEQLEADEREHDEINLEDVAPEELSRAGILDEDDYLENITEEDEAAVLDEIELEDSPADRALAEALLDDEPVAEDIGDEASNDELIAEDELDDENQFSDEEELAASLDEALEEMQSIDYAEPEEIEIPEPTEEERTVNMMIDQDLLAIAVEDDDGFTSTIVQKQVGGKDDIPTEKSTESAVDEAENYAAEGPANDSDGEGDKTAETDGPADAITPEIAPAEDNRLMETIIMEGESVMNEEDQERLEAARAAASESLKKADFEEDKAGFNFRDWRPPKQSAAAAAALLFVILIVQVIHQSREALAVSPAFQNTIGPVYRMIGSPIIPAWNVTAWRFEATKGSTNESGDVLTIYSRVGNNSSETLPYPLVHVELKDRFEEVIGSRILEPGEYLVDDTDPSVPVGPRDTFNAVIAINSPSAAATSFKLNVCYRIGDGRLRCDDKDFR